MTNDNPQWGAELTNTVATAMRVRRKALGMSAQALADHTAELGHPIGRSAIAAWENGSRGDRMLLADALILLHILDLDLTEIVAGYALPSGDSLRVGTESKRSQHDGASTAIKAISRKMEETVSSALNS